MASHITNKICGMSACYPLYFDKSMLAAWLAEKFVAAMVFLHYI